MSVFTCERCGKPNVSENNICGDLQCQDRGRKKAEAALETAQRKLDEANDHLKLHHELEGKRWRGTRRLAVLLCKKRSELAEEREKDYCVFFHDVCDELKKSPEWNSVQGARVSAKWIVERAAEEREKLEFVTDELEDGDTWEAKYKTQLPFERKVKDEWRKRADNLKDENKDLREALEKARYVVQACQCIPDLHQNFRDKVDDSVDAIRQALDQPIKGT